MLAIEQLGLYAGKRPVTADDVDDLIVDTREHSVFELTDALSAADLGRALAVIGSLCNQRASAVVGVVMLARYVRQLALVHELCASSAPRGEYASRLGVPPFVVDKIVAQARAYSPAALAVAIRRLAEADRALKGDQTLTTDLHAFTGPQLKTLGKEFGERVILEQAVGEIVQLAGQP